MLATRSRTPTVFSIYMVDVLCCALGCVILLWQYNTQEAKRHSEEAQRNSEEAKRHSQEAERKNIDLVAAIKRLNAAQSSIASLHSEVDNLKLSLSVNEKKQVQVTLELNDTRKDRDANKTLALVYKQDFDELKKTHDELKKTHEIALAITNNLKGEVEKLETQQKLTNSDLAARVKANAELLLKIAESEARTRGMEKDAVARLAELKAAGLKISDVEKVLAVMRGEHEQNLAMLKVAELRIKLLEDGKGDAQKRIQELLANTNALNTKLSVSAKDVEQAAALIEALKSDKVMLIQRNQSRFAGIQLTGKRVVFLVDMSGSMELLDYYTPEPEKWPIVCETVGRMMDSLDGLEFFQIILFADKVRYPLGNAGGWHKFTKQSSKEVVDSLKKNKPAGETNMYDAFNEAFRFRDTGLDTIYVFSDGLPNAGEGLVNAKQLSEREKTEILSKQVRTRLKTTWNTVSAKGPKVRINTIGFFFESPEVGAFLWALARENEGSFVGMSKP